MDLSTLDPKKRSENIQIRIDELRDELRIADPYILAARTGIPFERQDATGVFRFQFWQQALFLEFPSLTLFQSGTEKPPNPLIQAMVFYYFHTADGAPLTYRWIAFSELPNGMFYNQAFQGYTGQMLARVYQNDLNRFSARARQLEGVSEDFGDVAFRFQILPRMQMLVTAWQGDEDFPPSYKILFDSSVEHYLPTDGCAIAGSMLVGVFLKEQ